MRPDPPQKRTPRPHLGVHFACCKAYARIYLNRDGSAFTGHCPKCARPVRIVLAHDGSPAKFWLVE